MTNKMNAPSADAALRLAALYYDRGLTSDARATLSEVGLLDAAGLDALIRLTRAEAKAGYRDDALDRLERALEREENEQLAAVYAELDRIDDAAWVVEEALLIRPDITLEDERRDSNYRRPQDLDHYIEALRMAGVPER